jgi:hypothetical protein
LGPINNHGKNKGLDTLGARPLCVVQQTAQNRK